ncbi:class I SAM-dependent methyltransferase [Piscirickettsia litoralis]|uniref:class I SAM-dependent methyltransferase n=1 Tax=Piscirickettsia litoralis TaxID=1891921 RepID=UPI0009818F63
MSTLQPHCLDVGAGAGALSSRILTLIPHAHITAIDLSQKQLNNLKINLPTVTCWQGDIVDYHQVQAYFDYAWCNACFANFFRSNARFKKYYPIANRIGQNHYQPPFGRPFCQRTAPARPCYSATHITRHAKAGSAACPKPAT